MDLESVTSENTYVVILKKKQHLYDYAQRISLYLFLACILVHRWDTNFNLSYLDEK